MDFQFSPFSLRKDAQYDVPPAEKVWPHELVEDAPDTQTNERSDECYYRWTDHIFTPELYSYIAPEGKRTGQAILVCPGGGYVGCCWDKEGSDVARFLNANGISAFVLKYRDAAAPDGTQGIWPEGPLSDALRCIRIIRSRASQYGIDPHKVGVMGFSSGGHLSLTTSTLYDTVAEKDPQWSAISARPDFTVAVYPVCSLVSDKQHRGSTVRLLGEGASQEQLTHFSPECNVNAQTPPAFLVHAVDDPAVPFENSLLYFQALHTQNIPVEMHLFQKGGHGFGMHLHGLPKDNWPELMLHWLQNLDKDA